MRTNQLGKNGQGVSAVGLGTMGMNDMYGTKDTRNDAESGEGHNELLIREALKGRNAPSDLAWKDLSKERKGFLQETCGRLTRKIKIGTVSYSRIKYT